MAVGDGVGDAVGGGVAEAVGEGVGDAVGDAVGEAVGDAVGDAVGEAVGVGVGATCPIEIASIHVPSEATGPPAWFSRNPAWNAPEVGPPAGIETEATVTLLIFAMSCCPATALGSIVNSNVVQAPAVAPVAASVALPRSATGC